MFLNLGEADCEGIGNKARHLAKLIKHQPLLFSVPAGLVLLPDFSIEHHFGYLTNALKDLGNGPYAVRSCGLEEDGASESMAGKFHTELFVQLEDLASAINKVRDSYENYLDTSAVLVQKMIEPDYSGVLFTRSPENSGLASCEYSIGTADAVVSGKVEPKRIDYGRWTGNLYPEQKDMKHMLSLLFLAGMIIEDKIGAPQDIEWAFEKKKNKLYILQSRGITSHLYDPGIAVEQEKTARQVLASKIGQKGRKIFQNAAVREVVVSPSRLTRSLVELLYAPSGALGLAFDLLGLPCPAVNQPYVSSIFGQLYENVDVEKKLFGFSPKLLWANRKLKKKIENKPDILLTWLAESIEKFPQYQDDMQGISISTHEYALGIMRNVKTFTEKIYPVAYVATLLAQIADEDSQEISLTSQMMRDLSRLHHTGEMEDFLEKWGQRSGNDYELSEPRFCESPQLALKFAENFADFPWGEVAPGSGFTHLKEVAKDRAIRWLYPLRLQIVALEKKLQLETGMIFHLDLADIEALGMKKLATGDIHTICMKHMHDETQWSSICLGDEITLETLERLKQEGEEKQGLHGKMVSARVSFKGIARHVSKIKTGKGNASENNEVIIAQHLEPELVGLFPNSAGCLVDMGGALSHAAIVARELDYPVLVLSGCSSTIQDGDQIEVSADGAITITRQK